jgi:hypothetical protein
MMKIERFEDIEAWQLARELTGRVYGLIIKATLNPEPVNGLQNRKLYL